jgi:hypothetical protein
MNKLALLVASSLFAGCAGHAVVSSGPPPAEPAPPPPGPVVTAPPPAPPPTPDKHPAYMRALSDLKTARAFLERPAGIQVKWDEKKAVAEIDGAIQNIRAAAMDDGKFSLEEHAPVDRPTWGGRLQRAAELVNTAYTDVRSEAEDNPNHEAQKARRDALLHIQAAAKFIREGEEDAKTLKEPAVGPPPPPPPGAAPGQHPAYLHALTDLRHARALLEKPAKADVKWDENVAIREIDAAIKEIRDAAIDDGKPISEHPPIDIKIAHRDRLKQAMLLLRSSAHDIDMKEDNGWANGLRGRANMHINAAETKVREAIGEKEEAKAEKKEEKREEKMEKKEEKAEKKEQKMEKKDEKNAEKADKKADKKDDKTKAK